jgi:hypothetical protein
MIFTSKSSSSHLFQNQKAWHTRQCATGNKARAAAGARRSVFGSAFPFFRQWQGMDFLPWIKGNPLQISS